MIRDPKLVGRTFDEAAFIRIERRLRGENPIESSITRAPIEQLPQHHQYYGSEHLPSYIHMNTANGVPQVATENDDERYQGSSEVNDAPISLLPRYSIATLSPQNVQDTESIIDMQFEESHSKKKMKNKKGPMWSSWPSVTPITHSKPSAMPSLYPSSNPISFAKRPVVPSSPSILHLHPSYSPTIEQGPEIAPVDSPFPSSESLSIEDRAATVIVTTSAVVLVVLVLIAAIRRNSTRYLYVSKLNITDPALCGDASISSERSSTFRGDEGTKINDLSQNSSITSKMNQPSEQMSPLSVRNQRSQNGVSKHMIKLMNVSIAFSKGSRTKEREDINDTAESFPNLSPYLVDELPSAINKSKTTLNPIIDSSNEIDAIVKPISLYDIDGETLLEESDRLAWRSALDLDFSHKSSTYYDKLPDNRRPWRSHPYITAVSREVENQIDPMPGTNISNERTIVTKKNSMDEISMGSVDFIDPDIVQQFKVVDQRLSKGFEEFRAVEKRLSDGFDKLETTLEKNGHVVKSHINDETVPTVNSIEAETLDSSKLKLLIGLEKISSKNPSPRFSQSQKNDCHNDSSNDDDEDDDDDDDFRRRYQFRQLRNHFSSLPHHHPKKEQNIYQQHKNRSPKPTVPDITFVEDKLPTNDSMLPCHSYVIPTNPISLLTLPKQRITDSSSSTGNSINSHEVEDESDDILSTTEEYSFEKMRNRFNQH